MTLRHETDVLVIGSGAAGLATAINLPPHLNVLVLSKEDMKAGSTNRAQGGIAAVTDTSDSTDSHFTDTLMAGAGLCNPDAVRFVVERGASAVQDLIEMGLQFDRYRAALHRTKEGGHSHRRVLHVADATGRAIASTLIEEATRRSNIEFMNDCVAVELIAQQVDENVKRVVGAYVYNPSTDRVECVNTKAVILATGGASKVYIYTSNPDTCTGDGIAMAWRAGCRLSNMEFNQFHPTCLYHPEARSFLISEAVRGEGGKLRLPDGSTFMHRFDKREELASRDIVARAIDYEIKRLGINCVFLDISGLSHAHIENHFPTIFQQLLKIGIDMRVDPIPVVPAAHYTCGGVLVDRHGRTDLEALYAVGEVACTGVHGANRLASNSLLECLVYAKSAAVHIAEWLTSAQPINPGIKDWDESRVTNSDENVVLTHNWMELRRFMWDYVGIVRTDNRLERAANRINLLKQEVHEFYSHYRINSDLIELRNLINVAEAIVRGAQWRKESRGLHYTLDYPDQLRTAQPSIQYPPDDPLDVLQPSVARV
ncbi:MAG: L-aspartate oxidase [Gammaproteobacteria bacterium]|nr:L-aspartate oxidase [Gammaproteobacteria bacterium]